MSDLKNRINGVYGYYSEDESRFPNINELINLQIDCSWETDKKPEERDDLGPFKTLFELEIGRISRAPFYDTTLKQLIEMYLERAYIGPPVDREEGQVVASLADVYSYMRKNDSEVTSKGYDNINQFIPLAAGVERILSKGKEDVPDCVSEAYKHVKGKYNPANKIMSLYDNYRTNLNLDPNIYELVAFLSTAHMIEDDSARISSLALLVALKGVETDRLVERKIVDSEEDFLCVFLTKLRRAMIEKEPDNQNQLRYRFTAEQAKAMADISSVYFFIKQQERDLGQYRHNNFDEFKRLTSEYSETIITMPNSDLIQQLSFMLDYISSRMLVQKKGREETLK